MHFTEVLYRHHYGRYVKRMWKRHGKLLFKPLEVPTELKTMGAQIYDALDIAKNPNLSAPIEKPSNKPFTTTSFKIEPLSKKYYLFDNKVRVSGDENAVLSLTKTVSYSGLPYMIQSLLGIDKLENQDQIVKNSILQAVVLDSDVRKLPKKVDLAKPGWKWPREYGPRHKRKACNLIQKLAFLAEMNCGKYPEAQERFRNIDAFTEVSIERGGESILFQLNSNIAVTSKTSLRPFASMEEVEATKDMPLPSLYPVKATLDLWQRETDPSKFSNIDNSVVPNLLTNTHIHTLHIVHESFGFWFPVQKMCRSLATCFMFTAEEARRLYGDDVQELPYPISVQCIYSDTVDFGVIAFQLNTLDLSHDEGIKNQVWIQPTKKLYSEVNQMHGIKDFNPEIFNDIMALYLNGIHPSAL